jgi:DNA-binding transcriptional LysR family regulator
MQRAMSKTLPPLNAVRAFEAASRHLNLSRAADELGVTQGAISKQVIALEDFIGCQLFEREPTGLILTVEGANLREALRPVFLMMGEAFARYSRRPPRSSVVRISTLTSFASQFLVPRLTAFSKAHPGVELEFLTSNRMVDFTREEIDIAVRYGPGDWDGVISTPLVKGVYIPVCRPDLFERAGRSEDNLVMRERRIQHAVYNEWAKWSDEHAIRMQSDTPNLVTEDFLVALKACLIGYGIALLPDILVRDLIRAGELVEFSAKRLDSDYTYHVVHAPNAERRQVVKDTVAWLKAEAAKLG